MRRFVLKPQWILGHFMVVAAALTCIRLADWQLSRAHITEALQNWGYALQWPLFSAFFLIGWWRMLRLESIRLDEQETAAAGDAEPGRADADRGAPDGVVADGAAAGGVDSSGAAEAASPRAERRRGRGRPPLTAPLLTPASQHRAAADRSSEAKEPEDEQLAAYNRMLAKLAAQDAARDEAGRR